VGGWIVTATISPPRYPLNEAKERSGQESTDLKGELQKVWSEDRDRETFLFLTAILQSLS
jgi:hypothetical protein